MKGLSTMSNVSQIARDVICVGGIALGTLLFAYNLESYVSGLERPGVLVCTFVFSLLVALFYDVKDGMRRFILVRVATTIITFVVALLVAHWARDLYSEWIIELVQMPGAEQFLGADYYRTITNRTLGYGVCFGVGVGVGVSVARLLLYRRLEGLLVKTFIRREHMPVICPHCNQPMHG